MTILRTWSSARLATKLGFIGAMLLVLALASIGLTISVTWQLEGGAAAVNEAGRLRMQTWRLAHAVSTAGPESLQSHAAEFDKSLQLLEDGAPARPLFVPKDDRSRSAFADVKTHWQSLRTGWTVAQQTSPTEVAAQAQALVVDIDAFVQAIEKRLSHWTALLSLFQLGLMGLAIAGSVALLYAAHLFVFNPLARLQAGLARIERADFSARIDVESQDEFGHVAEGFNRMANTMQGFYRELEDKVTEKTLSLHAERQRLTMLYEASGFVARTPSLQALADGFAPRLRAAGRADAAVLRWFDPDRQHHVLLASDCLPEELLAQEACLQVGDCHCGQSDTTVDTHIIRIQPVHDGTLRACHRLGFQTVITVPLRRHDQLLGEADLLYRSESLKLSADDRALLDSLAAHLASGIESLRAAALEREAAVAEERGLLARELHDSIAQGLAFMKIQVQLLRGALKRGDAAVTARTVQELDAGVQESTADVRELLLHFRTRTNSDDILQALKVTLQKFQHQTGIATELITQGHGVPLAPDVQLQLLHVVQEALSNVRKHAQATQVRLQVQQQPEWQIDVVDDGCGITDQPSDRDETHVGMRIMRERAASVGAQVQVMSAPGAGTRVIVKLPAKQAVVGREVLNA